MTPALHAELWTLGVIVAVTFSVLGCVMLAAYLNLEPIEDLP